MPDSGWWEALWPEPAKVIVDVGVRPGMGVVDLCAGDGWFTWPLSKIARRVIAIEIDVQVLQQTRERFAEHGGAANCQFVEGDAYHIGTIVGEPVDHVFMANALHGVPDRPRLSEAVHDVLRSGGLFAIVSWHATPREETWVLGEPRGPATTLRMTPQQTAASVEPAGFKLRYQIAVSPYHYGAVFERVR